MAGVSLDDICHFRGILRIGESRNGVHPTVGEVVRNSVLGVNKSTGLRKESCHACTTKVVPLLGGGGMDRGELIW